MAVTKWREIYKLVLKDINNGVYLPGMVLPTTDDFGSLYGVSNNVVQKALNRLQEEGFIITLYENFDRKRIVMPEPKRSLRAAGFKADNKDNPTAFTERLELDIINDPPDKVKDELGSYALRRLTRQWRDHIPVAVSESYIPPIVPLKILKSMLTEGKGLYASLEELGFKPATCQESLVSKMASEDDMKHLYGPKIVIVEIERKVYDKSGNLIELCFLKDRADSYVFSYKFKF